MDCRQNDGASDRPPMERFRSYLLVLARAGLPSELRSKMSASDVVQQTFLKAHRARAQVRDPGSANMAAWLRRILVRVLQDGARDLRRGKRDVRMERSLQTAVSRSARRLEDLIAADQTTPSEAAVRTDRLLQVSQALEALPELQRRAVLMKHWEGYTLDEIAERLDRSPAAVASLLRRGLGQIREQMKDE